jgi:phage-related protein
MIGTGLAAIGVAVGGSGLLIVEFLKQLINLLPQLGTKLGEMLVNMAKALGDGLAEITTAIETVLMALLTAIQNVLPKVIEVAVDIVVALAEGLAQGVPAVATAALELVKGVLQGIAANIEDIVVAGMDCVIGFMDGIASRIGDVIQSGIELALSFIEGVADGLTNNKERMAEAVRRVIKAMLTTGVEVIKGGLTGFLEGGKELLGGLVDGIKAKWPAVKEAVKSAIDKAKGALANAGSKLVQAGKDLIQGFINGIASKAYAVAAKAREIASNAVTAVTNFLGINSPSRVFMGIGKYTAEGMAIGLDKYSYLAEDSASGLAENVVKNVKNPLSNIAKLVDGNIDVNPTITPVMDLSNVEQGARRLSDMIGNQDVRINARTGMLAGSVGTIQNGKDNSDVISALKDLKEGLNNNTSYTINGITYDDGSNITNAVETLVRAARIERRI